MTEVSKKVLYWTPRCLGLAFALYLSMFAMDVFGEGLGFWRTSLALFMHLIPVFVLLLVLALAWRWEWIGAAAFAGAALVFLFNNAQASVAATQAERGALYRRAPLRHRRAVPGELAEEDGTARSEVVRTIRRKGTEREQRASVPPTLPTASITTNSQAFRETADGRPRACAAGAGPAVQQDL